MSELSQPGTGNKEHGEGDASREMPLLHSWTVTLSKVGAVLNTYPQLLIFLFSAMRNRIQFSVHQGGKRAPNAALREMLLIPPCPTEQQVICQEGAMPQICSICTHKNAPVLKTTSQDCSHTHNDPGQSTQFLYRSSISKKMGITTPAFFFLISQECCEVQEKVL